MHDETREIIKRLIIKNKNKNKKANWTDPVIYYSTYLITSNLQRILDYAERERT